MPRVFVCINEQFDCKEKTTGRILLIWKSFGKSFLISILFTHRKQSWKTDESNWESKAKKRERRQSREKFWYDLSNKLLRHFVQLHTGYVKSIFVTKLLGKKIHTKRKTEENRRNLSLSPGAINFYLLEGKKLILEVVISPKASI